MTKNQCDQALAQFTDLFLSTKDGADSKEVREFRARYKGNSELQRLFDVIPKLRANLIEASEELITPADLEEAQTQAREWNAQKDPESEP